MSYHQHIDSELSALLSCCFRKNRVHYYDAGGRKHFLSRSQIQALMKENPDTVFYVDSGEEVIPVFAGADQPVFRWPDPHKPLPTPRGNPYYAEQIPVRMPLPILAQNVPSAELLANNSRVSVAHTAISNGSTDTSRMDTSVSGFQPATPRNNRTENFYIPGFSSFTSALPSSPLPSSSSIRSPTPTVYPPAESSPTFRRAAGHIRSDTVLSGGSMFDDLSDVRDLLNREEEERRQRND